MKKEVSLKKGLKVPMYLFNLKKGQRRNITNIDILILALIYTFSDKESKCYLTNTEIANLLDISKVQVSDRLHYLDKNKYLAIIQNNKKGRTLFIPSSLKEDITKSFSGEYKFLFIPSEIFNLKTISLSEKFILSYIVGFCKSGKLCKTSKKKLYKWFNISENTLQRALSKFKKLDLIETTNITNSFNRDCGREIKLNLDNLKAFYINEAQIYKAKIENVENAKVENVETVESIETVENINNVNNMNIDNLVFVNSIEDLLKLNLPKDAVQKLYFKLKSQTEEVKKLYNNFDS